MFDGFLFLPMKTIPKHKQKRKTGLPPGTVIFTGEQKVGRPHVTKVVYNEENHEEKHIAPSSELQLPKAVEEDSKVTWYDVRGLHDTELIEEFGRIFNMHALVMEDIVSTQQVPKFEEYESGFFVVMRALTFGGGTDFRVQTEQVCLFVGKNFVLSFQEDAEDLFLTIRERIAAARGRVRKRGADYLAYALMDLVVDNYFLMLDDIGEEIEKLELHIIGLAETNDKSKTYELKRQLLTVRKSVLPLREAVNRMLKAGNAHIEEENLIFLRDLNDHLTQVLEVLENYREMVIGLQDLYLSEISLRMNNVMKVLTIISTIFIPLTFLAGIYGMNFDNMPELRWKYGYFFCLAVMAIVAGSLVYLFKKRNWI